MICFLEKYFLHVKKKIIVFIFGKTKFIQLTFTTDVNKIP